MQREDVLRLLFRMPLNELLTKADAVRHTALGEHVFVRGLIEFSNSCVCGCRYCGLRRANTTVRRYRLAASEIIASARQAVMAGADTVVLQSGEDPSQNVRELASVIEGIKNHCRVAVTLSIGEHTREAYAVWRAAGADRFLIRHETADADLYAALHPGRSLQQRLRCLRTLQDLGYAVGTGFIVGLPGQRPGTLADDILLARKLNVDMCGIGPFIPQADTPLGGEPHGSVELTLRALAVTRLALPQAHLPATTALATLAPVHGQRDGLRAGGNVLMPGFTPADCRTAYNIYDDKRRVGMTEARAIIKAAGRTHALPPGDASCSMSPKVCACT